MGYTHYFNQRRNFTRKQWEIVSADLRTIVTYAQHECGIALANGMGDGGTSPEFTADLIMLNGVGDDSHETFMVRRAIKTTPDYPGETDLGGDFTKTAQKPYDAVVTACLCYLTTATRREDPTSHEPIIGSETFSATSDGKGADFLVGLDLARKALPHLGNVLDIPMEVMKEDRWCAPWVNGRGGRQFEVHFCVDGKGYVLRPRTGESYCFESHLALAQFLERTKSATFATSGRTSFGGYGKEEVNIWNAYGSFDEERFERLRLAQKRALSKLFPVDPACAHQPPAFVRPGEMPDNAGREFCYSVAELMNLALKA